MSTRQMMPCSVSMTLETGARTAAVRIAAQTVPRSSGPTWRTFAHSGPWPRAARIHPSNLIGSYQHPITRGGGCPVCGGQFIAPAAYCAVRRSGAGLPCQDEARRATSTIVTPSASAMASTVPQLGFDKPRSIALIAAAVVPAWCASPSWVRSRSVRSCRIALPRPGDGTAQFVGHPSRLPLWTSRVGSHRLEMVGGRVGHGLASGDRGPRPRKDEIAEGQKGSDHPDAGHREGRPP